MSFLFGSPVQLEVLLDDDMLKPKVTKTVNKQKVQLPIYHRNDDVTGKVFITLKDKKLDHQGIKIEFVGAVEYAADRSATSHFISQVQELQRPGTIVDDKTMLPFAFSGIDKRYDSYSGKNVRLRYYLRVSILKRYTSGLVKDQEIWVVNYNEPPERNDPILMEVGVEKTVSIEFRYSKTYYSLQDIVLGKVNFRVVRLPLQSMEIRILRKETSGFAPNVTTETEVLAKYELMDGLPVKGESMPIRIFLSNLDLTPTYNNVNNMFSVQYFLHLVLIEEDDKRYFKQCEFKLWRQAPDQKRKKHDKKRKDKKRKDKAAQAQDAPPAPAAQVAAPQPAPQEPVAQPQEDAPAAQPAPAEPVKDPLAPPQEQLPPEAPKEDPPAVEPPAPQPTTIAPIDVSQFIQPKQPDEDIF